MVAPKCTSGLYWPTDPPPLAAMKAAKVELSQPVYPGAHGFAARRKCCRRGQTTG